MSDDGELSSASMVEEASRRGIRTLAITDHNRTAALIEARAAAATLGVSLIAGIEIDCTYDGVNLHLLGYGIDETRADFESLYTGLVAQEDAALDEKLFLLAREGILLEAVGLRRAAAGRAVTAELIAETLLADPDWRTHTLLAPYRPGGVRADNPYVNFYWDWFHQGRPCYVPLALPDVAAMVTMIRGAGGVPVLAHPGVNLGDHPERLDALFDCGVEGVEVFNNYHSPAQMAHFRAAAKARRAFISCGSDFHGRTKPSIVLGQCCCPAEDERLIAPLLERCGR